MALKPNKLASVPANAPQPLPLLLAFLLRQILHASDEVERAGGEVYARQVQADRVGERLQCY